MKTPSQLGEKLNQKMEIEMDKVIQRAVDLAIYHQWLEFLKLIEEFIDDGSGQIDYSDSLSTLKTIVEGEMCEAAEKAGMVLCTQLTTKDGTSGWIPNHPKC